MSNTIHFLITYDHDAQTLLDIEHFSNGVKAVNAYNVREQQYEGNCRIEVVLLGAHSEETIRATHSTYFGGTLQRIRESLLSFRDASVLPSA